MDDRERAAKSMCMDGRDRANFWRWVLCWLKFFWCIYDLPQPRMCAVLQLQLVCCSTAALVSPDDGRRSCLLSDLSSFACTLVRRPSLLHASKAMLQELRSCTSLQAMFRFCIFFLPFAMLYAQSAFFAWNAHWEHCSAN